MSLNQLPKFYAGIGSRKSPDQIKLIMKHCGAFLFGRGWHLRSGAAEGADQAFEAGHDLMRDQINELNRKEIYLPWRGYNGSKSMLQPDAEPFTEQEIQIVEACHSAPNRLSPSAFKLHARNVRILFGLNQAEPVKFVICWTEKGRIKGGTGLGLIMAEKLNIPVINFGSAKTPAELEALVIKIDMLERSL